MLEYTAEEAGTPRGPSRNVQGLFSPLQSVSQALLCPEIYMVLRQLCGEAYVSRRIAL